MKGAHKSASCVAFVAFFLHAPAGAQATQDVPDAASGVGLDDIIVTAEKRSSSVQRTPISIQAVDGATLRAPAGRYRLDHENAAFGPIRPSQWPVPGDDPRNR